jgi:hypothetical protein
MRMNEQTEMFPEDVTPPEVLKDERIRRGLIELADACLDMANLIKTK